MPRSKVVCVRLSKVEDDVLEMLAGKYRVPKSEIIRRIIRGYLKAKGYII